MSTTELAQQSLEKDCAPLLQHGRPAKLPAHKKFLRAMLGISGPLPAAFLSLDASHPWMVFWPVNALALLGRPLTTAELENVGETLLACQHKNGGFGGGLGQPGHLAATYAAVMALAYTGPKFWERIDRVALQQWIMSLKTPEGSFRVCQHGECDPRATYCALAVATLLGVASVDMRHGCGEYIASCQSFEGGFANMPLGEAHGGYSFCSLATLMLLNPADPAGPVHNYCDVGRLQRWLVGRQDLTVPGFQGRTNKLVDGCYSHWVAGCWPLLEQCVLGPSLWFREGLQTYIVRCCQHDAGGLRDKPGTRSDTYHTNYCLCGLACARYQYRMASIFDWSATRVLPDDGSQLEVQPINPIFGITFEPVAAVHAWSVEHACSVSTRVPGRPPTKEYQGFALYIGATLLMAVYACWALLPASWLNALRIDYYPSRWWAVAVPAFVLVGMMYVYTALAAYNVEKLTYPPTAPQTVCDADTRVHDVPIVEVNHRLYTK